MVTFYSFIMGNAKARIGAAILEVIRISGLPEMSEVEGEKGTLGGVGFKVLLTKSPPSSGPIVGVKHENIEMHVPFVFLDKMVPKGLDSIAPKKDVVLVFLDSIAALVGGINVQTSFGKSGFSRKTVMVHEQHKGLDFVWRFKLLDSVVGQTGINRVPYKTVDAVVGTFARKGDIPCKSPKRSVLFQVRALKKYILDIISNTRGDLKR